MAEHNRSSGRIYVRIAVVFGVLILAYYAFAASDLYRTAIFQPYVRINVALSGALLQLFGADDLTLDAQTIASPRFSLTVGEGCDGLEPTWLFVAALLAFPASVRLKLPALAVGVPLLISLNLVRIISLFYVGIYFPSLFHLMHVDIWQILYIFCAMGFFIVWLAWATRHRVPASANAGREG